MKAKSFVKTISDYRNTFLAANFLSLQPGGSLERISIITNFFLRISLLSYSNSSTKGTVILGSILYLSLLRPAILYVCNLEGNLLFFTLILGSVFCNYVVFYGD